MDVALSANGRRDHPRASSRSCSSSSTRRSRSCSSSRSTRRRFRRSRSAASRSAGTTSSHERRDAGGARDERDRRRNLERHRGRARRPRLARALAPAVPGQGARDGVPPHPARDPVHRARDLAAAALPRARDTALDPDRHDRARRDQPPVHDPRAAAATGADRSLPRRGGLRPRRRTIHDVPPGDASAHRACRRLSFPDRFHDLVRRVRGRVVPRRIA